MSTRYVWNKYTVTKEEHTDTNVTIVTGTTTSTLQANTFSGYAAADYRLRQDNRYDIVSPYQALCYGNNESLGTKSTAPTSSYPCAAVRSYDTSLTKGFFKIAICNNVSESIVWAFGIEPAEGTGNHRLAIRLKSGSTFLPFSVKQMVDAPGELLGKASNAKNTYYPNGGVYDDTWYALLGSDSIDPSSLTYSKTELQGGEPVTITAKPVTPTYGGTISYQFSYSTNGGSSWVNIGSKTTATSQTLTIPNGVSQFQARVQASDDLGFTSSDYVMGQAMEVISMQAYVGIGGKARRIEKIYIGVNGKAREVIAGYVGVNGKARKFL